MSAVAAMSLQDPTNNPYRSPADAHSVSTEPANPEIARIRKRGCLMMFIAPMVSVLIFLAGIMMLQQIGKMNRVAEVAVLVTWVVGVVFNLIILPCLGVIRLIWPRLYLKDHHTPEDKSML